MPDHESQENHREVVNRSYYVRLPPFLTVSNRTPLLDLTNRRIQLNDLQETLYRRDEILFELGPSAVELESLQSEILRIQLALTRNVF